MKANEARELSQSKLKGPVIEPLLKIIYDRVREAAEKGKSSIYHPFSGIRMTYPTSEEQQAVWQHLSAVDGYNVKHHPGSGAADPREGPYTEISWG